MQHLGDHQRTERDACGIGFVADAHGRASRQILDAALEGLANVRHRGAVAADRRTGDGAGLLLPIPAALVPGPWCGLAQVFLRDEAARGQIESACEQEGIEVAGWRTVPVVPGALGRDGAREPAVDRAARAAASLRTAGARGRAARLSSPPPLRADSGRLRRLALVPHRDVQGALRGGPAGGVLSGSASRGRSRFPSRSSTSASRPTRARRGSGRSRSASFATTARSTRSTATFGQCAAERSSQASPECSTSRGSDSSLLDNALELLVRNGRDVRHAASMLLPRAWHEDRELDPDVAAFHRYHAGLFEPWDGPAAVVFTDGRVVGAALDRNGLRPLRVASAGALRRLCVRSGCGAARHPPVVSAAAASAPASCSPSIPASASRRTRAIARRLAGKRPYRRWLDGPSPRCPAGRVGRDPAGRPGPAPARRRLHA